MNSSICSGVCMPFSLTIFCTGTRSCVAGLIDDHCLLLPMQTRGSPLTSFVSSGLKSAPPYVNPSGSARIMSGSAAFRLYSVASWDP